MRQDPPPLTLLTAVREQARLRHYILRTEASYVAWIRRFIQFCGSRHPPELGATELTTLVTHLAVDLSVAASTKNQALQALLFLFRNALQKDLPRRDGIVRANRPHRLPTVVTPDEG